MDAEGGNRNGHGEPMIRPEENRSDEHGQDARSVVVDGESVDHVVVGDFAEQNLSARDDGHRADDEGENRCNFIECCVHIFPFSSVGTTTARG